MADVLLAWGEVGPDLVRHGLDLSRDDGLTTAIILSLFTDRRAAEDDKLPDNSGDRRGWWADAWPETDGDLYGSRLWLLAREKQLPEVVARAREYAREALAWLIEDGLASTVDVQAEVVRTGVLGLQISIHRPGIPPLELRFHNVWEAI